MYKMILKKRKISSNKRKLICILFVAIFGFMLTHAQNFDRGFNFNLPGDDGSDQEFLPVFPAEEIGNFIQIDADGHFSTGNPIRFWGVNLTTDACFPLKEKSPFIASRMRKMGINLVRFHHMDNGWTDNDGTIFLRNTGNTRSINPETLDRFLFLLAEMKKNNIYANINLHVSRTFLEGDGVIDADSIWQFGKGVTYFDPQLIALQKEFAQQILTAENPYTNLKVSEDPVIAMVEITNENTLYGMWKGDQLKPFHQGGDLMLRHSEMLDEQWRSFLIDKYPQADDLRAAWLASDSNEKPPSQIINGDFEANDISANWDLELHQTAAATMQVSGESPFEGSASAQIIVTNVTGTAWHIQFQQDELSMEKDSNYVLEFYARADRNRRINATLQRDVDPWTWYGGQNFELTPIWQKFRLSVTAIENNQGLVRATFNFANETGSIWFDQVSFSKPVKVGLEDGEDLSNQNIRRIDYSERLSFNNQRVADLAQFYLNVQRNYYREMYHFLKDELNVKVPITGTNALIGPADVFIQQDLDYIDDHAYWNHPRFPNEPWSSTDWFIDNESLLSHDRMGTMSDLFGGLALDGKPYTISEYNHPFPNRYHYEMFPVMAAHASYHDADGIMFFQYHGGSNSDWESDFIPGFFGIHRNHSLMSMSPILGYAYRNQLISSTKQKVLISYDSTAIFNMPFEDNFGRWGTYYPYDQVASYQRTIRTAGFTADATSIPPLVGPTNGIFQTDNDEIYWDANRRLHTINSEQLQAFTGALGEANDLVLAHSTLHRCSDEGVIIWMSLDGAALPRTEQSILSLHSRIQNTGMSWDGDQTVRNQWGSAPTEILALQASLTLHLLADSLHFYPLDEVGRHSNHMTVLPSPDGTFQIDVDQLITPTPWFGIRAFRQITSDEQITDDPFFRVWPNPSQGELQMQWNSTLQLTKISLRNNLGQLIESIKTTPATDQMIVDISTLSSGTYFLQIHTKAGIEYHKKIIVQ